MSAQVPPASPSLAAAAGVPRYRSCSTAGRCRIRLIKAIRSPALPYCGNYAAVRPSVRPTDRPTEYRIVSSNFSAPRSTIHQHACGCPDSACSVSRRHGTARHGGEGERGVAGRPRTEALPSPLAVIVITSLPPPIFHPILRPLCPPTELQRRATARRRCSNVPLFMAIILLSPHADAL